MSISTLSDRHLLRSAGIDVAQFDAHQLRRMDGVLRKFLEDQPNRRQALRSFARRIDRVLALRSGPKSFLKRILQCAATTSHSPYTRLYQACVNIAVDDLFGRQDREAQNAWAYFTGESFATHCYILGIDVDWARQRVNETIERRGTQLTRESPDECVDVLPVANRPSFIR